MKVTDKSLFKVQPCLHYFANMNGLSQATGFNCFIDFLCNWNTRQIKVDIKRVIWFWEFYCHSYRWAYIRIMVLGLELLALLYILFWLLKRLGCDKGEIYIFNLFFSLEKYILYLGSRNTLLKQGNISMRCVPGQRFSSSPGLG